jgi:hypothetical protein
LHNTRNLATRTLAQVEPFKALGSFTLVEDALFETVVLFFICLDGDGSVGFTIGNGLKQPVGDGVEEGHVDIWLGAESCLDGMG